MATITQAVPLNTLRASAAVKRRHVLRDNIVFVLMLLATLIWLVPIFGALVTAVRTNGDIIGNGFWSIPNQLTLDNFGEAWAVGRVEQYLGNSFIITIPSLIGMLLLSSMGAFALARYNFRGNMLIYFMFVAGTMLPFQILLLPVFYLSRTLHLYNQYSALILIHTAFQLGFCTFVLRNYMRTVPNEILEAARMDGAGDFRLYWRIMLPLSLSSLAALATLEFTWVFNDYLWAIILISDDSKKPVTAGLQSLQGQYLTNWPVLTAGALLAALPTVVVFVALQRYFIQGLTMGSGK